MVRLETQQSMIRKEESKILNQKLDYVQPSSQFISEMPEQYPHMRDMSQFNYWLHNCVPLIVDYCKDGFEHWRIEMSFAELLHEFRRDNWKEGFYKAYILCDWRMPNGIKLPEPNHD